MRASWIIPFGELNIKSISEFLEGLVRLVGVRFERPPVELGRCRVVLPYEVVPLGDDRRSVIPRLTHILVVLGLDVWRPLGHVLTVALVLVLDSSLALLEDRDVLVHLLDGIGLVDEPLVLVEGRPRTELLLHDLAGAAEPAENPARGPDDDRDQHQQSEDFEK